MKNLVIILSHCDTPSKIKILKETIVSLRSIDVDIFLTSHISISPDIQDMVDYYIFDKSNPIINPEVKKLITSTKRKVKGFSCNSGDHLLGKDFVVTQAVQRDHWGGVMNQIKKAADVGLSLDYDCYSFIGYDVTLEEVHLKELDDPCPTEDIVTCDWGDSSFEIKKVRKHSQLSKENKVPTKTFISQYAGCDFNIIKKDCFKKIRTLFSLEKYLERDSNGERLFDLGEEYWTSLVYLFKSRFVKRIDEKVQIGHNQNYSDDLFEMFISQKEEGVRNILFFNIKESVKFRINNEKIIELKDNHLEMGVKQIQYLMTDSCNITFSKEMDESDEKKHRIVLE